MAAEEEAFEKTRMTLGEHLEELRKRLVIGVGSVVVIFAVAWFFKEEATVIVSRPHRQMVEKLEQHYVSEAEALLAADTSRKRDEFFVVIRGEEVHHLFQDTRMTAVGPGEGFFFTVKICLYLALFVGAPILLWQLWLFIASGLYKRERRIVLRYFPASSFLFFSGVLFGYFLLVPYGLYFLNLMQDASIVRVDFRVQEYFSFISGLCLGLGVVFQLPIVMVVLSRLDIVEPAIYSRYRGHALVIAMIVSALLTPPDPWTQAMMALPVMLLYEIGIWCSRMSAPPPLPR
jgi:Tat protein translocase TatC